MAMNKKIVSTIALSSLTAALLTLTGCGSSSSSDTAPVTPPPAAVDADLYDGAGAADVQERHVANDGIISTTTFGAVVTTPVAAPTLPTIDTVAQSTATVLTGDITADKTLSFGTLYKIDGLVKVKNNATLTIEPGTVIFGEKGANYIVVTKGSKIIADGTEADPIIFTSALALADNTAGDVGQWGGLTVLGGAPTNHAAPFYEVDETDADFAFGNAVAGAGDAADNSGILRNVYILNSGEIVATDLEINGLSLAGVGSGTVVENIYVENSSDDCIEIWGGTVNVTNATLKNCNDDSFDLDYGYVGTADNIVVEQVNASHAGFEISSGGTVPMTGAEIKNFRIVKVDGSDEGGIYIKDDSTAPIFGNGYVTAPGSLDAAIHTKKAFAADQKAQIEFKDVYLKK
ncbi:MAG: right-handed parallel beta-helix repeat-containing protein [Thiovulaceae bacterium]|nr:right-handed parallel beta-helix repeat-containing protein [Sulfurimonadaceae bacterium]